MLRAALLEDGRRLIGGPVGPSAGVGGGAPPGQRCYQDRDCEVLSVFGPLTLRRDYYHPAGPEGGFPLDRVLGIIGRCTPGAAPMWAHGGPTAFCGEQPAATGTSGLDRGSLADPAFGATIRATGASTFGRIAGAGPQAYATVLCQRGRDRRADGSPRTGGPHRKRAGWPSQNPRG